MLFQSARLAGMAISSSYKRLLIARVTTTIESIAYSIVPIQGHILISRQCSVAHGFTAVRTVEIERLLSESRSLHLSI